MLALEAAQNQIRTPINDSANAFQETNRAHFVALVNIEQLLCHFVLRRFNQLYAIGSAAQRDVRIYIQIWSLLAIRVETR